MPEGPDLDAQVLAALERALAEGQFEVAEHLLRALEALCPDAALGSPLGEAYLAVAAPRLGSVTELCDAQVDHGGGEMGETHPTTAGLVAPESDTRAVLEPGEQVLDVVAPGVQHRIPCGWIDHAALGRGVDGAALGGEGCAEGG